MVQINSYADDMVIMSRNLKTLKETLQEVDNTAQERGFMINQEKPKCIYTGVRKRLYLF